MQPITPPSHVRAFSIIYIFIHLRIKFQSLFFYGHILSLIEQLRNFHVVDNQEFSNRDPSLLFTFATLLDLSDLQSAVRATGIHDFRPSTLLYRGDQSFHRLYVHVFGTDLQRGARKPISNTFPDTGSLRFREIHSIQTEPRQVL